MRAVVVGRDDRLRTVHVDVDALVRDALGGDLDRWSHQCHAASCAIVQSGLYGDRARVARGGCSGVRGQHSWVVVSRDAYDLDALIIDPTLWSYRKDVEGVWLGSYLHGWHLPHGGFELIWAVGRPPSAADAGETPIELTPRTPLSEDARRFLDVLGPLGRKGWGMLVNQLPPHGWPAGEIITAMKHTPDVTALVPIDLEGMLTDRNPGSAYLFGIERDDAGAAHVSPPSSTSGWECLECGAWATGDGVDLDDPDLSCIDCADDGRDPYLIERYVVTPCPGGECEDENHHHGRGTHWTPYEQEVSA